MQFRPCIDIHNGRVKQIIGGSLKDEGDYARENFVADKGADYFAGIYRENGIKGGHIILLNPVSSQYYEDTKAQALMALKAYPGGLQVGGGINPSNAGEFINAGASHVIATSYVFSDGRADMGHLEELSNTVGRERLVLDLSCRKKDNGYYIVTDRWQKFTEVKISGETLDRLCSYCDEFLVHAVDVEGKGQGIESELIRLLAEWCSLPENRSHRITYAGGVGNYEDIELIKNLGGSRINVTIGSALDLFGGSLAMDRVLEYFDER